MKISGTDRSSHFLLYMSAMPNIPQISAPRRNIAFELQASNFLSLREGGDIEVSGKVLTLFPEWDLADQTTTDCGLLA
jgi:hypothetical protein